MQGKPSLQINRVSALNLLNYQFPPSNTVERLCCSALCFLTFKVRVAKGNKDSFLSSLIAEFFLPFVHMKNKHGVEQ